MGERPPAYDARMSAPRLRDTIRYGRVIHSDEGAAGKVLLIIAAIIVLLGAAAFALWNPVIRPLIGEAVPVRVTEPTPFEVPYGDPQVRVTVPTNWTMQRALYNPQQALLKSPDLGTEVLIDTWKHGASPTLGTAIAEATDGWVDTTEPRFEQYSDELTGASVIGSPKAGADEQIVIVVAEHGASEARGSATITVSSDRPVSEILPAIAHLLTEVTVP